MKNVTKKVTPEAKQALIERALALSDYGPLLCAEEDRSVASALVKDGMLAEVTCYTLTTRALTELRDQEAERSRAAAELRIREAVEQHGLTEEVTEEDIEIGVQAVLEGGADECFINGAITAFINMLAREQ